MHAMKSFLLVALAVALTACGAAKKKAETGEFSVTVAAASGVAQAVWIRVQGVGIDKTLQATSPGGANRSFTATFTLLPPGTYSVHGWGYDAADPVKVPPAPATYETRVSPDQTFVVTAGSTTTAHMILQEKDPQAGLQNAPLIAFISASSFSVEMSSASGVTLTARVTDADANLLAYTWSDGSDPLAVPPAPKGAFTITDGSLSGGDQSITTHWTPTPGFQGNVDISLEVTDSTFNASTISIRLNVFPPTATTGTLVLVADINAVPIVDTSSNLFVTNGMLVPTGGVTPAPATSQTQVSISAYDPDPQDILTFAYTNDCGGTFAPTEESSITGGFTATAMFQSITTFTAPADAPTTNSCILTVVITDGRGSSVQESVVIHVGPPAPLYGPEFTTNTAASPVTSTFFPAHPGEVVAFTAEAYQWKGGVQAFLPSGAFAWTFAYPASDGTLVDATPPGSLLSMVRWVVPAAPSLCVGHGTGFIVTYSAEVLATGDAPAGVTLDATTSIPVDVVCP